MATRIDLTIQRGKTFEFGFLYADNELVYKDITAMPSVAPVRLTVVGHGIPDGWPVQIQCVKAPVELNTDPEGENPQYFVKVIDADTIELNSVNAHCWKAFSGSGLVIFNKPMDLTGWSCRSQVRDKVGGTVLFSWNSDPLELPDGEAVVDIASSAFFLKVDAATAEALEWKKGVYDVEAINPAGEVFPVTAIGQVVVSDEVTIP